MVNQWLVDSGVVQTGGASYTLPNIQVNHSVQVTFTYAPTQYTISATAGSGGALNLAPSLSHSSLLSPSQPTQPFTFIKNLINPPPAEDK